MSSWAIHPHTTLPQIQNTATCHRTKIPDSNGNNKRTAPPGTPPHPPPPPHNKSTIFRASCTKRGARSSAPQCVAGSDVAERQGAQRCDRRRGEANDADDETKRGKTPAAGWIEGPPPGGGGGLNHADAAAAWIHPVSGVERQKNERTTLAGPIPYLQEGHFGRIPQNDRFGSFWRQQRPSDERREEKITERSRAEQSRALRAEQNKREGNGKEEK